MRAAALTLSALCLLAGFPQPAAADSFEDAVLRELNRVRADPAAYARELRRSDRSYDEADAWRDPDAVDDAIGFLRDQRPLPPLRRSGAIAAAAEQHVERQGPRGDVGHGPHGSLGRRLQREGVWAGLAGESISYGQRTPRDVVRQLIVDAGVPNRSHRKDIFGSAWQIAGVACGRHARWGSMCVIDFAGALVRR
jgi:hypothetical protein